MAKPQEPFLTIVKRIKAPVEAVFQAWTDAAELKRWMAPADKMSVALAEADARVGGRYRVVMRAPSGEEHRVGGTYREISLNRRLVFTWAWESTPERESLVTIDLKALDRETEMTLTHERFFDKEARDRHLGGWEECLASLVRHLGSGAGASAA